MKKVTGDNNNLVGVNRDLGGYELIKFLEYILIFLIAVIKTDMNIGDVDDVGDFKGEWNGMSGRNPEWVRLGERG